MIQTKADNIQTGKFSLKGGESGDKKNKKKSSREFKELRKNEFEKENNLNEKKVLIVDD